MKVRGSVKDPLWLCHPYQNFQNETFSRILINFKLEDGTKCQGEAKICLKSQKTFWYNLSYIITWQILSASARSERIKWGIQNYKCEIRNFQIYLRYQPYPIGISRWICRQSLSKPHSLNQLALSNRQSWLYRYRHVYSIFSLIPPISAL